MSVLKQARFQYLQAMLYIFPARRITFHKLHEYHQIRAIYKFDGRVINGLICAGNYFIISEGVCFSRLQFWISGFGFRVLRFFGIAELRNCGITELRFYIYIFLRSNIYFCPKNVGNEHLKTWWLLCWMLDVRCWIFDVRWWMLEDADVTIVGLVDVGR